LLNFSFISISSIYAVWNGRAASLSGQALREGLPDHPASRKDRSGQQPVNSGQKRRIENLDNLAWRMGEDRQGRT
jgi:hypothetical protein